MRYFIFCLAVILCSLNLLQGQNAFSVAQRSVNGSYSSAVDEGDIVDVVKAVKYDLNKNERTGSFNSVYDSIKDITGIEKLISGPSTGIEDFFGQGEKGRWELTDSAGLVEFLTKIRKSEDESLWGYQNISEFQESEKVYDSSPAGGRGQVLSVAQSAMSPIVTPTSFEAQLVDAVGTLITERFKQGVTETYLNKFRMRLDESEDLQKLFPQTYKVFKHGDPFNYVSFGNQLKPAFERDMRNMLENVHNFIEKTELEKIVDFRKKSEYQYLNIAVELGLGIEAGKHPTQIIDQVVYDLGNSLDTLSGNPKDQLMPIYQSLLLFHLFEKNLRVLESDSSGRTWVSASDFESLNDQQIEKFLAYIYVEGKGSLYKDDLKDIFFLNPGNWDAPSQKSNTLHKFQKVRKEIAQFLSLSQTLANDYQKLKSYIEQKNKAGEAVKFHDYSSISSSFLKWTMQGIKVGRMVKDEEATSHDGEEKNIEKYAEPILLMSDAIFQENYGEVVIGCAELLNLISGNNPELKEIGLLQDFAKYGNFASAIAQANTAEEMKEAINEIVLPPGSVYRKRTALHSFSISAHPGVIGSYEWESSSNILAQKGTGKCNIGLTAPVGFELTFGFKAEKSENSALKLKHSPVALGNSCHPEKRYMHGSNFGIFFGVADLGAVFNYRLTENDSSAIPSTIRLKQVVSPSVFLQYGFKNTPLTLGFGAQYTPELRNIDLENQEFDENSFRVGLRLSWDIPLINIQTRDYQRKKWEKVRKK